MEDERQARGRVLVVDDKYANRELLRQDLEEEGFEVTMASNGVECIEVARKVSPEVIILDVKMPRLDGIQTCGLLKADPVTSHIPIIFVTGHRGDEDSCVAALAAGGNDFLAKPYSRAVLVARLSSQVAICRTQLRLRALAMTDELTGVYSRRALLEAVRRCINQVTRVPPHTMSFVMVDVDHFKTINDSLGHRVGDRTLVSVAEALQNSVRASDAVGRLGGDEFGVLLPQTDEPGAILVAKRILGAVAAKSRSRDTAAATVSVGVATFEGLSARALAGLGGLGDAVELLLNGADEALYGAKHLGRNRWGVWDGVRLGSDSEAPVASGAATPLVERRRHERLGIPVTVELRDVSTGGDRRSANLSTGGLALADGTGLSVGGKVDLRLHLEDRVVDVRGTVVWTGVGVGQGAACGVAFESFRGDGLRALERFLEAHFG